MCGGEKRWCREEHNWVLELCQQQQREGAPSGFFPRIIEKQGKLRYNAGGGGTRDVILKSVQLRTYYRGYCCTIGMIVCTTYDSYILHTLEQSRSVVSYLSNRHSSGCGGGRHLGRGRRGAVIGRRLMLLLLFLLLLLVQLRLLLLLRGRHGAVHDCGRHAATITGCGASSSSFFSSR